MRHIHLIVAAWKLVMAEYNHDCLDARNGKVDDSTGANGNIGDRPKVKLVTCSLKS